jgi:N-acyl-phosphatidylethanolamine-hydrolysing phospholipase D
VDSEAGPPLLQARPAITYIGHATLLLRFGDVSILSDPNFDARLGVFLPRVRPPGMTLAELPELSAILLTHAHADHLSFRSLRLLPRNVPIYAPAVITKWLHRSGIVAARPINPGETVEVRGVMITAASAKHMGARYSIDRWRGDAQMYLMDDGSTSVLYTGDTALTPEVLTLVRRIHPRLLDVALLPIGYAPRWKRAIFRRGHLTAADALDLFVQLDARRLVPFHWGTFRHITSGPFDAIRELRTLLESHRRAADVTILEPGGTLEIPKYLS